MDLRGPLGQAVESFFFAKSSCVSRLREFKEPCLGKFSDATQYIVGLRSELLRVRRYSVDFRVL